MPTCESTHWRKTMHPASSISWKALGTVRASRENAFALPIKRIALRQYVKIATFLGLEWRFKFWRAGEIARSSVDTEVAWKFKRRAPSIPREGQSYAIVYAELARLTDLSIKTWISYLKFSASCSSQDDGKRMVVHRTCSRYLVHTQRTSAVPSLYQSDRWK